MVIHSHSPGQLLGGPGGPGGGVWQKPLTPFLMHKFSKKIILLFLKKISTFTVERVYVLLEYVM
jgi:hypothetical protein